MLFPSVSTKLLFVVPCTGTNNRLSISTTGPLILGEDIDSGDSNISTGGLPCSNDHTLPLSEPSKNPPSDTNGELR